jgi:hypothetical protein
MPEGPEGSELDDMAAARQATPPNNSAALRASGYGSGESAGQMQVQTPQGRASHGANIPNIADILRSRGGAGGSAGGAAEGAAGAGEAAGGAAEAGAGAGEAAAGVGAIADVAEVLPLLAL